MIFHINVSIIGVIDGLEVVYIPDSTTERYLNYK